MNQETKILGGIFLATLVIMVSGVFFMSKNDNTPTEMPVDGKVLQRNIKHTIASASAQVSIVEFADFQCPACAAIHPVIKQLLEEYEGKITFAYRHFPLPQHQNAISAALASEAASEQGKFWEMYDLLYTRQTEWDKDKNPREMYESYAAEIGLDNLKFTKAMENTVYEESIKQDKNDGYALGINSTPTFFINNRKLIGAPSYTNLKTAIDAVIQETSDK